MLLFIILYASTIQRRTKTYHPLELGRFPLNLGQPISPISDPSCPGCLRCGTNPGRRCGGTNLSGLGEGRGSLSLLSRFETVAERDDPVPVRPNGRREIASEPGSDRGGWNGLAGCWSWGCCGEGGARTGLGLGVGRVRTRMRPWGLLGEEIAE